MSNNVTDDLETSIRELAAQARKASRPIARASTEQRTQAILAMADQLLAAKAAVEAANAKDLQAAEESGRQCDQLDRGGE